jgi:hypothetical protein
MIHKILVGTDTTASADLATTSLRRMRERFCAPCSVFIVDTRRAQ